MNQNYFFDKLILMYLYKKESISTLDIENEFGGILDKQNVNNIISNRKNTTSYIYKGFIDYDQNKHTLTITKKGENLTEQEFSESRS
ncbi:hypothetical protein CPIN17262_0394 [Campylobacter pinnipediorum subsp. pinnipediorum]|uniref:hypothetical protein n=1 Tax=Campylobacter pinnipediorum TaxID=1965231 RepID=UPI000994EE22|nr:hypothetical protein [Campylobacter pinnipediorum]AQW84105.1 hypothetical protein CPIN17262_0394 [Campylobacter pinnipediorum subsp. pinnipediorum]